MSDLQAKLELLSLIEQKREYNRVNQLKIIWLSLYEWQRKFVKSTSEYLASCLMAANRVGKTYTGCFIDACHLTGDYPDDWDGHKFTHPPLIWILGYSGEKIRDLLQSPIFGTYSNGELSGGLINKELIADAIPMLGTSRSVREVKVRHKSGGFSRCQFWSYTQGQHALMGDSVDWYHIDEEPKDATIYPQVITRTATGDKGNGGRGILTFTPENGRTELVVKLMDDPSPTQYMQRASWDDAKHLTEEVKEALLSQFPPWQRDMRTKGLPLLGTGLIFDLDIEQAVCKRFECPNHWLVINGMDFGWDHPQAHIQLWIDLDEDVVYVAHAVKMRKTEPFRAWHEVKSWAKDVPTAWPLDGLQSEKRGGTTQKSYYEDEGWTMLDDHATWEGVPKGVGNTSVEHGLVEIYNRIKSGKLKIFEHLNDLKQEFLQYHRNERQGIVKINDDLLDALRYAYMMRRYAIRKMDVGVDYYYEQEHRGNGGGWG